MGFPIAIGAVILLGLVLVLFARDRRNADAFPRANADHVHSAYDVYVCAPDASGEPSATTTTAPAATGDSATTSSLITTTTAATSTTVVAPGEAPGQFLAPFTDAQQDVLGIHTHGDGLIHIHPFTDSAAGRKATLGLFLDQVGVSMTNDTLTLATGQTFKEGQTKCQGGKDGELQVAKWNDVNDAAAGKKPNEIFTSGFDQIRLGANNSFTIAFMPPGSTIPAKPDVASRIANVSDLQPSTTPPASGEPASGAPPANGDSTTTVPGAAPNSSPDTATSVPASSGQ
jgi:hypothetical protein